MASLIELMESCSHCKNDEQFSILIEDLKQLIPFDSYGISRIYMGKDQSMGIDSIRWFSEKADFESRYFEEGWFRQDPLFQKIEELISNNTPLSCFYLEHSTEGTDLMDKGFEKQMEIYSMNTPRFVVLQKLCADRWFLFVCESEKFGDPDRYDKVLRLLTPSLYLVTNAAKIGRMKKLTEKEFILYHMMDGDRTSKDIASAYRLSTSTVEKHRFNIRLKLGRRHRFKKP